MARVTHVKKAQQRYETKPVFDANGNQLVQTVLRKDGTPKLTKNGRAVERRVTTKDLTKPLPPEKCDKCGVEIAVGQPYKHMKIKTSTYGSRRLVRCAECPSWHEWEYRSTRGARAAQIQYEGSNSIDGAGDLDGIKGVMEGIADEIIELAEEAREGAQNIEDGFGHPTSQSEELEQQADELESWADEIRDWEPSREEEDDENCEACDGAGTVENPDYDEEDPDSEEEIDCEACDGAGTVEADGPSEDLLTEWRSEASDLLHNCPI